jgi:DNA polymerase-3 subunit delta
MMYKTETTLKQALDQGDIRPVYLIYGQEDYDKTLWRDRLVKAVLNGSDTFFDLVKLDGKKLPIRQLAEALETVPLLAGRRCVLAEDFDAGQYNGDEAVQLAELLEALSPDAVLLLVTRSAEPDGKKAPTKKLLEAVDRAGALVECRRRGEKERIAFATGRAAEAGLTLSNRNARLLLERCGEELWTLASETDKLIAYQQKGEITREAILRVSCAALEADIYALSRHLIAGDLSGALGLVDRLFGLRYPPTAIIANLGYAFTDLCRADAGRRAGKTAPEITEDFGYRHAFRVTGALRDSRRLDAVRLGGALDILVNADLSLKSERVDERVLVETAVAKICETLKGEKLPC